MNEIKKCSISGVAFTLDVDAYEELERYLESLRQAYRNSPDGTEIVADIEARIAELILSAQDGGRVVEKPLVLNIIGQLGSAEDISDKEGDANPDADLQPESPRIPRRLYCDMENAKLGGVCAGLGKYFGIDAVWIRLGMFVPLILDIIIRHPYWLSNLFGNIFGVFLLSYLIMWFAVPVARSARQKLEMNGEPITTRSVAAAAAAANDVDSKAKPVIAEAVSVFGKIAVILMKLFAGMLVFGLILVACGLIIGLLCVGVGGYEFLHMDPGEFSIWLPITGILIALIPVFLLIYVLMCLIASRKPNGKSILAMFLLWAVTIAACVSLAIRSHYTTDLHQLFRYRTERVERVRPDMEELEEQLEALESYSISIQDSTNNVNIKVERNRKTPVPASTAKSAAKSTAPATANAAKEDSATDTKKPE
ncbi:MAG: PspC domain-containing protein [Alistipes senegalensis]|nr:PspC domain-containing protein [Bacteroides cellulosilyticus]MCM1351819.1 PspC domain-containing protein [Alistipes senegalensis]